MAKGFRNHLSASSSNSCHAAWSTVQPKRASWKGGKQGPKKVSCLVGWRDKLASQGL